MLMKGVSQEYETLKDLESQKKDIHIKQLVLQQQLSDDRYMIIDLKKKLIVWVQAEADWHQKRAAYKEKFINSLQDQSHSKQLSIAEYILKKDSMPLIIDQAKKDLIKKYDIVKSSHYIEQALETLSEKRILL